MIKKQTKKTLDNEIILLYCDIIKTKLKSIDLQNNFGSANSHL